MMDWYILLASSIASIVYLAGIYSHSKIIKVSLKDKDMSWQLDVIYSCVRVFVNTFACFLYAVTYIVPNLYLYTGRWFCYASKLILHYNNMIIAHYTLIVAILKYVVIVYWQWARGIGHDKIKALFSVILGFCVPMINVTVYFAVRPDFLWVYDGYKQVDMCLGDPKGNWAEEINQTQTKLHTLCVDIEPATNDYFPYFFSYSGKGLCWMQVIFNYLAFWNLLDCVVYIKLFIVMKRQINRVADSLNDETNTSNMKKLKVNAQVTAINTLVEMACTITYIIILAIMKGNTFATYIYAQFFYNILLPFTFLSNTSNNKTRIVEVGWKNVLKNIINNMKNQMYAYLKIMGAKIPDTNMGLNRKQAFKNRVSMGTISDGDRRLKSEGKNEIYTTRVMQNEITANMINELNVPMYEAEQSGSKFDSSECHEECSSQSKKCSKYEQLDANKLLLNDSDQLFKKKMITGMIKEVNFEEKYLNLFKNFVAFHEGYISKEFLISNVLQDDQPSPNSNQNPMSKKQKRKGRKSYLRNKTVKVYPDVEKSSIEFNKSKNVKDRTELRLNLLTDAQFLQNENDALEEMIERIITLEESFLESN